MTEKLRERDVRRLSEMLGFWEGKCKWANTVQKTQFKIQFFYRNGVVRSFSCIGRDLCSNPF